MWDDKPLTGWEATAYLVVLAALLLLAVAI